MPNGACPAATVGGVVAVIAPPVPTAYSDSSRGCVSVVFGRNKNPSRIDHDVAWSNASRQRGSNLSADDTASNNVERKDLAGR
jgi:hypothetical protein